MAERRIRHADVAQWQSDAFVMRRLGVRLPPSAPRLRLPVILPEAVDFTGVEADFADFDERRATPHSAAQNLESVG